MKWITILTIWMASITGAPVYKYMEAKTALPDQPFVVVLGTIQDGGSPHVGCKKSCCADLFGHPDPSRKVVSLGVVDPVSGKQFLLEASPDMASQLKVLKTFSKLESEQPDAIFLSHAHIGHYTGLMYLGKEAMDAKAVNVYTMPRMNGFLTENGPWSQLVNRGNIQLHKMENDEAINLTPNLSVRPILVPHRDEYSETVGFVVTGPQKSLLFIPDIDKWEKWDLDIISEIAKVDYALLDGTFYSGEEINTRDISQIPHPFIIESLQKLALLPSSEREKVNFIHFNHTNPALDKTSDAYKAIISAGFGVAQFLDVLAL